MKKLTKEQKMEIVSNAIDAGFRIEMFHYDAKTFDEISSAAGIFKGMKMNFKLIGEQKDTKRIAMVNKYNEEFKAVIFFD